MEDAGLSGKQMEQMFAHLAKLNKEQVEMFMSGMASVVKELRKPTEAEQAKLDKEKADAARKLQNRILAAKADEQGKEMRRKGCSHADPNGHHSWRTQVNSDGYWIPRCQICGTLLPRIKATDAQLKEGVNLHTYKTIDMGQLEKWAAHTNQQSA